MICGISERAFPTIEKYFQKVFYTNYPQKTGENCGFSPRFTYKRVFSNAPKDWILLFGILNVLIPALSTTLTDLEANFIEPGHIKTCSANQFWNGCFFLCLQTTDRMWRRTRKPNNGSGCVGTDPNRNWGFHWNATNGSSTDPCAWNFMGSHPFSEVPQT